MAFTACTKTQSLRTNGVFHLNSEVQVPSQYFQPEHPLKSEFRLGKLEEFRQPRSQNLRWVQPSSTEVKAVVNILFIGSYVLFVSH